MKFLILAACLAVALADVKHILKNADVEARILRQEADIGPEGSYQWAYETSNGINAEQQGQLKSIDAETSAQVVQGQASWTSPEGEPIQLQYVADENGYQPQGSHLPTSPPIPEAILRSLQYIQAHPPQPEAN